MSRRGIGLTTAAAVLALLGLYALAGFFGVPYLIERRAASFVGARIGADLQLGEVRFNPFTLRLVAKDLRLAADDAAQPLLRADGAAADLAWASLWSSGWQFSTIALEGAQALLRIGPDGRLNWAALYPQKSNESQLAPPRLRFEQIKLASGRLTLVDQRGPTPASVKLSDVVVTVSDLATYAREGRPGARYSLSAALDGGGTLRGEGSLGLQPQLQSSGTLQLADIALAELWPLLRRSVDLALEPVADKLSASARYRYAGPSGTSNMPALHIESADFSLRDVAVRPTGSETALLRLDELAGRGGQMDLAARGLSLAALELRQGQLQVRVDAQGDTEWSALAQPTQSAPPEPATKDADAAARWQLRVEALRIDSVALHVADRSRQPALALDIANIDVAAAVVVAVGAAPMQLDLSGLDARLERPRLTLVGDLGGDAGGEKRPADPDRPPQLAFDTVSVSGAVLHTDQHRVEAEGIRASGGHAALELGGEEHLSLLQALRLQLKATAPAAGGSGPGSAREQPWRYAIGSVGLESVSLDIRHSGFEPAIAYDAELGSATLSHVDSTADAPMQLQARFALPAGGSARVEGTIAQDLAQGEVQLQLKRMPLPPLQPLLARYARLELQAGELSAQAELRLRRESGAGLQLHATGQAELQSLQIDEAASGDRFLSWRSLQAAGVQFDTTPGLLKIASIEVQEPGAKLVIFEDRSVNVTQLMRDDAPGKPSRPATPQPAQERPPFEVAIDRIRIHGGVLDFADLSLVLPFSTRVSELEGAMADISTRRSEPAQVEAAGQIGPYGSARFGGSLLPFAPKQFLDIDAVLENVEIPPFSPYTATFAGRTVEQGKLWLDLDYHIEDRELLGKNTVRLSDFQLGERVEAESAMDLPLDMAVALLKDEQGTIQLSVPVSGDLDKPTVDVGFLVREAVGKAFQRIVSAPFRALGRLFGSGSEDEDIADIRFAAGSEELSPPQREKLQTVGRALAQRPQLRLVIDGPYAQGDAQAMRRRAARDELARTLGNTGGGAPGPIAYQSERTQAALEDMLARYGGAQALSELRGESSAAAGGDDAPAGKAPAQPAGPHQAMFERIVERYPLSDAALQMLASRRAQAIRDYLVNDAGAPAERLRTGRIDRLDGAGGEEVSARLELDPIAAPAANPAVAGGGYPHEPMRPWDG